MAREEKKTVILQAASRVFYVKGFEGTKIDDVAKEAGIGKGTVYEYFASKQQLFEETVAFHRNLHLSQIKRTLEEGRTFREKFIAMAKYQTETVKKHLYVFNAMTCSRIMAREMGALILEQNIRVGEILKERLIDAVKNGELRSDIDPDIAAAVIMGTVNQYCGKKVVFFNIEPEDVDFEKMADTVLKGIGAF
ncbi:MAG: HTH-type transcriptional regulator TtgR [Candidatus Dichloromethanomonas elyunquensis]|nr:MAG: HTH-type transcriptional regulator TtgR [Candidatus Dichloromethanomonas elyunquensis]